MTNEHVSDKSKGEWVKPGVELVIANEYGPGFSKPIRITKLHKNGRFSTDDGRSWSVWSANAARRSGGHRGGMFAYIFEGEVKAKAEDYWRRIEAREFAKERIDAMLRRVQSSNTDEVVKVARQLGWQS